MNREEIVEGLKLLEDNMVYFDELQNDKGEWIDVHELLFEAIQALSQEPCTDAVSREEVKKIVDFYTEQYDGIFHVNESIDKLPSVTQKSGKWMEHPEIETTTPEYLMFYECSECGYKPCFCKSDIHKKRFCSNCGAKMESEGRNNG